MVIYVYGRSQSLVIAEPKILAKSWRIAIDGFDPTGELELVVVLQYNKTCETIFLKVVK